MGLVSAFKVFGGVWPLRGEIGNFLDWPIDGFGGYHCRRHGLRVEDGRG